jgi:hypothetical protein
VNVHKLFCRFRPQLESHVVLVYIYIIFYKMSLTFFVCWTGCCPLFVQDEEFAPLSYGRHDGSLFKQRGFPAATLSLCHGHGIHSTSPPPCRSTLCVLCIMCCRNAPTLHFVKNRSWGRVVRRTLCVLCFLCRSN